MSQPHAGPDAEHEEELADAHRPAALFSEAHASPAGGMDSERTHPANDILSRNTGASARRHTPLVQGSAKKPAGGLLRHALSASAIHAGGPVPASPHVQSAFKEILASPSPKVSVLAQQIMQKEAQHVERVVEEREREQKRAAMLAEAQKVREVRRKAAQESVAAFNTAQRLAQQADAELAQQRKRSDLLRSSRQNTPDGHGDLGAGDAATENEDAELLRAAELKYRERVREADVARAAMASAQAEHDQAVRRTFIQTNLNPVPVSSLFTLNR